MVGLNCDSPSARAFAELRGAVAAAVTIEDDAAAWAMQVLAAEDIEAGESGAAGLAGLAATVFDPGAGAVREACALSADARVLVINTERVTDPVAARRSLTRSLPGWPEIDWRAASLPIS
jgi:threonine dehydratase